MSQLSGSEALRQLAERERLEATRRPPRGPLTPEVEKAARLIHRAVWVTSYKPGEGPMHHAGGPYWRIRLLRLEMAGMTDWGEGSWLA